MRESCSLPLLIALALFFLLVLAGIRLAGKALRLALSVAMAVCVIGVLCVFLRGQGTSCVEKMAKVLPEPWRTFVTQAYETFRQQENLDPLLDPLGLEEVARDLRARFHPETASAHPSESTASQTAAFHKATWNPASRRETGQSPGPSREPGFAALPLNRTGRGATVCRAVA